MKKIKEMKDLINKLQRIDYILKQNYFGYYHKRVGKEKDFIEELINKYINAKTSDKKIIRNIYSDIDVTDNYDDICEVMGNLSDALYQFKDFYEGEHYKDVNEGPISNMSWKHPEEYEQIIKLLKEIEHHFENVIHEMKLDQEYINKYKAKYKSKAKYKAKYNNKYKNKNTTINKYEAKKLHIVNTICDYMVEDIGDVINTLIINKYKVYNVYILDQFNDVIYELQRLNLSFNYLNFNYYNNGRKQEDEILETMIMCFYGDEPEDTSKEKKKMYEEVKSAIQENYQNLFEVSEQVKEVQDNIDDDLRVNYPECHTEHSTKYEQINKLLKIIKQSLENVVDKLKLDINYIAEYSRQYIECPENIEKEKERYYRSTSRIISITCPMVQKEISKIIGSLRASINRITKSQKKSQTLKHELKHEKHE